MRKAVVLASLILLIVVVVGLSEFWRFGTRNALPSNAVFTATSDDGTLFDEMLPERDCHDLLAAGGTPRVKLGVEYRKKKGRAVSLECLSENDPRVPSEWKTQPKMLARYKGHSVYLFGDPQPVNLSGAYVLLDPASVFDDTPEIDEILVDRPSCESLLALHKKSHEDDIEWERSVEHDAKGKAEMEKYRADIDENSREAGGVCLPASSIGNRVKEHCEGLPFELRVVAGTAVYACATDLLRPKEKPPGR
jgi:hypothetical protein